MLYAFLAYLFSSHKKTYRYLARCYNISRYRVCALDHGKKARTGKDHMVKTTHTAS